MGTSGQKESWETYLEWDVLGQRTGSDAQVYEVIIKVRPDTILCILKAEKGEQRLVSFCGGRTLRSLSGAIRKRIKEEPEKWRADKFYNT